MIDESETDSSSEGETSSTDEECVPLGSPVSQREEHMVLNDRASSNQHPADDHGALNADDGMTAIVDSM